MLFIKILTERIQHTNLHVRNAVCVVRHFGSLKETE